MYICIYMRLNFLHQNCTSEVSNGDGSFQVSSETCIHT